MKRIDQWQVLPHELAFGVFVIAMMARLIAVQGIWAPIPWIYGGILVAIVIAIAWCRTRESDLRWRLRLGLYPVLFNVAYFTLGTAIPAFHPGKEDAWLQSLDARLTSVNASVWMERFAHPVVTEVLSACYLVFFPFLLLAWVYYFRGEVPVLRRFMMGMATIYGLGFLGYSLVPAMGPHLDPTLASQFHGAFTGGWFTRLNQDLVLSGSYRVDVFPSLHCGITLFTLLFDRLHAPRRFRLWLLPVIGLWIATVYLRYHYVVDVLVGFALAMAAFAVVRQSEPTTTHELSPALQPARRHTS